MSSLRFCHERGQIKRWEAVRHVIVSGISMRVFFIFIFSHKKSVFRRLDVSCVFDVFRCFFGKMVWSKSAPEVSGTTLGPSPTYSGPILTHFASVFTTFCNTHVKKHSNLHCVRQCCIIMHDYLWLCMIMCNYLWLCIIMHNYAWLCMIMHNYV